MKIKIISGGYFKKKPEGEIFQEYKKRLRYDFQLIELNDSGGDVRVSDFQKYLVGKSYNIVLDEAGKSHSSIAFAEKLQKLMIDGHSEIHIFIGGANGLPDCVKEKAHLKLAFGAQTWPHLLVRVMIIEQLYRAQEIISGGPYHKA